jgi:competence protein ComEC
MSNMVWRRLCMLAQVLAISLAMGAGPALADQVTIQRHVTVREGPNPQTGVVVFPDIGATLELLDAGSRRSGYYHVALPDGRTGWVYYTFVSRQAGAESATLAAGALPSDRIAVHYINVDQGAAALLEFPCGAVMIDTGGRGDQANAHLAAYLEAFFARRPDLNRTIAAVFITHTHVDHNSNLKAVAQAYRLGGYIHNGILSGSGRANARWMAGFPPGIAAYAGSASPPFPVREISEDDVNASGAQGLSDTVIDPVNCARVDPKIRVLSARYDNSPGWSDGDFDNGNNQSLVIRVDYGAASFLFTGDLEEPAIETLVGRYAGSTLLDVDVWEVGHHGSANGVTESLLKAVTPKVAVISMGAPATHDKWTAWAYGHPRRSAVLLVDRYTGGARASGATVMVADKVKTFSPYTLAHAVYGTGWDGDITVSAGPDGGLRVEPGR